MPLNLFLWSKMTASERLEECASLTTVRPMANSAAPAPINVVFTQRCGAFLKGESAALPPLEAAAVRAEGFAS